MTKNDGARATLDEIRRITRYLVESGLANDQNVPISRTLAGNAESVEFPSSLPASEYLKDREYRDTYELLREARSFNILMLDGAILQLWYYFVGGTLERHRLALLPSPDLPSFHSDPEAFLEDQLYLDVIDKGIVGVPVRFDFDLRDGVAVNQVHPVSHLTLGQYSACRVAATAAVTPYDFTEFILRAFYNTATRLLAVSMPSRVCEPGSLSDRTITVDEARLVHIGIPNQHMSTSIPDLKDPPASIASERQASSKRRRPRRPKR